MATFAVDVWLILVVIIVPFLSCPNNPCMVHGFVSSSRWASQKNNNNHNNNSNVGPTQKPYLARVKSSLSLSLLLHRPQPQYPLRQLTSDKSNVQQKHRPRLILRPQQPKHSTLVSLAAGTTTSSLVSSSDSWGNWMVLTGVAAIAQRFGSTTRLGRLLGAPVSAMAITFVMASVGVLHPGGTWASKSLQVLSIQMATPLVLLGADFSNQWWKRCNTLILSFVVASFGTILGCYIGWNYFGTWLSQSMSNKDGLKIAAALLAKNVGGGINYVAVCRTLQASPASMAAGLCVDNLMALVYFPLCTALGAGRPDVVDDVHVRQQTQSESSHSSVNSTSERTGSVTVARDKSSSTTTTTTVQQITTVISLSTALLWLGERVGGVDASLPTCTLFTVVLAHAIQSWMDPISSSNLRYTAEYLGTTCLYWFFATAGAPGLAVAESVRASLLPLGMYLISLYGIHAMCLYFCYQIGTIRPWRRTRKNLGKAHPSTPRLSKVDDDDKEVQQDKGEEDDIVITQKSSSSSSSWRDFAAPQRLLVASSAAIGGPATAVALAQTHGWTQLQVPSILVGNLGYAIATFCGLAFYKLLLVASP